MHLIHGLMLKRTHFYVVLLGILLPLKKVTIKPIKLHEEIKSSRFNQERFFFKSARKKQLKKTIVSSVLNCWLNIIGKDVSLLKIISSLVGPRTFQYYLYKCKNSWEYVKVI